MRLVMPSFLSLLSALALVVTSACTVGPQPQPFPEPTPQAGTLLRSSLAFDEAPNASIDDVKDLGARQLELAGDLLAIADAGDNQALSPTSIAMAFAMLSTGARGDTLAELEAALHLPPQAELHQRMNALLLALRDRDVEDTADSDGLELSPVNELFPQDGFNIEAAFLDTLGQRYDAGVRLMDYRNDAALARDAINAYVDDATRGKIDELLPEGSLNADTRLVLVNALYLKGAWQSPFEPDLTRDEVFHAPGGDVTVPFMHGNHDGARYSSSRGMEIIELPFIGGQLALDIIPLDSVAGALDYGTLADELEALSSAPATPVNIALPRFTVRVATDLVPALQDLGVSHLFADADLSGISTETSLAVTGAYHETFFALDEKGVEAAAATAIVVGETSIPPPPQNVVIDGPFVFVLRDTSTNTPLFVGSITDPS